LWIGGGVECAEPSRLEIQEVTSGGHHVEVDFGVELSAALENAGRVVPQSLEMEVFGFFRLHQNCDRVSHLRIFNDQGEDGTYGQGVPLISGHQVLAPGRPGWFPGAVETGEQRTNIGFINPSATTASVRIGVFDLAGSEVGASIVEVPARSIVQVNRYLREFSDLLTEGRATVQVTVESGAGVLAYDSRVFARTGDPVFRWGRSEVNRAVFRVASKGCSERQWSWQMPRGSELTPDLQPCCRVRDPLGRGGLRRCGA
jgi:hypothetical protein